MVKESDYISIHTHTDGSHNDGIIKCDELCKKASELGQKWVSVTDHNSLAAIPRFVEAANKYGINPIIGSEFYFVKNAEQSIRTKDNERFHLIVIAKNNEGLQNLIHLHNQSWTKNYFRMNPRSVERGLLDIDLLSNYSSGLIVTTACYFGGVPQYLFTGSNENALKLAADLKELFGEDLYFEVADHKMPDETEAFNMLIDLARKMDVRVVAAQDAHYLNKEDAFVQELLIGTRFGYYSGFKFPNDEFYFKSAAEMSATGLEEEYLLNTRHLAEKVEKYNYTFKTPMSESATMINCSHSKTISPFDALSRYSLYKKVPSDVFYSFRNRVRRGEDLDTILKESSKSCRYFEENPMLEYIIRRLTGVEVGLIPQKDLFASCDKIPPDNFPLERKGAFLISQWATPRK